MTHIGDGELVAILNRIGEFDPLTMKPLPYPGGYRITAPPEEGNAFVELGYNILENTPVQAQKLYQAEDRSLTIFGIVVPQQPFFRVVRLDPRSGGLRLFRKEELPHVLDLYRHFEPEEGVRDRQVIALPEPDIQALHAAFAHLA